jgi:hypothetical protein
MFSLHFPKKDRSYNVNSVTSNMPKLFANISGQIRPRITNRGGESFFSFNFKPLSKNVYTERPIDQTAGLDVDRRSTRKACGFASLLRNKLV